jgi:hypothetical protein
MTSNGHTPPPPPGTATVREDVHIHAGLPDIHRRIADPEVLAGVLSHHFRDVEADHDHLAFTLALPTRREGAELRRDGTERGAVTYLRRGDGAIDSMTWAVHAESARECHVTVEVAYRPLRGPHGALLETLVHKPHRAQALRDSLWALKREIEGIEAE